MAREIEEIFDEMITEKESKATLGALLPLGTVFADLLNDITSGSKVADWRLWVYLHAFGNRQLEVLFDKHKAEVELIKDRSVFGTELFWIDKMLEFQIGFSVEVLEVDGFFTVGYANIDTASQIIKAAAIITDINGFSTIKVAKLSGPDLVALSAAEILAVNSYRDDLQPAGAGITVVSLNPDLAQVNLDIHFNPQFDLAQITIDVEKAINDYFKDLDFGGIVLTNSIIDALQAIESVRDAFMQSFLAKPDGGTFAVFPRSYETSAGYIKVDPGTPLSGSITYIAQP